MKLSVITTRFINLLRGDCVVLTVKDDTLIVDAGNRSAEEVKSLASVFFKEAYKL